MRVLPFGRSVALALLVVFFEVVTDFGVVVGFKALSGVLEILLKPSGVFTRELGDFGQLTVNGVGFGVLLDADFVPVNKGQTIFRPRIRMPRLLAQFEGAFCAEPWAGGNLSSNLTPSLVATIEHAGPPLSSSFGVHAGFFFPSESSRVITHDPITAPSGYLSRRVKKLGGLRRLSNSR